MYKTLLVPIDIAEVDTARPALERAVALAQASNGTVRLIHVRSLMPVAYMEFVPATFDIDQQRDAESRLAEIAASVPLPAERVSATVRIGAIYNEILEEAETTGADLIVGAPIVPRWRPTFWVPTPPRSCAMPPARFGGAAVGGPGETTRPSDALTAAARPAVRRARTGAAC